MELNDSIQCITYHHCRYTRAVALKPAGSNYVSLPVHASVDATHKSDHNYDFPSLYPAPLSSRKELAPSFSEKLIKINWAHGINTRFTVVVFVKTYRSRTSCRQPNINTHKPRNMVTISAYLSVDLRHYQFSSTYQ